MEDQLLSTSANEKRILRREGAQHKQVSPANVFPCKDGYVYLFVSAGAHWKQFLNLWPDHPSIFDGPEWEPAAHRRVNAAAINAAVSQFTRQFCRAELVEKMQFHGIPCLPVNSPQEFLQDEQIQFRGFLQTVHHPRWGDYRHPGVPYFVDGVRMPIAPAPGIGQHNVEIYGKLLKMEPDKLALLRTANVI